MSHIHAVSSSCSPAAIQIKVPDPRINPVLLTIACCYLYPLGDIHNPLEVRTHTDRHNEYHTLTAHSSRVNKLQSPLVTFSTHKKVWQNPPSKGQKRGKDTVYENLKNPGKPFTFSNKNIFVQHADRN